MATGRVYNIVKGKTIKADLDYGQAVVDAHALGEGTRIFSVGSHPSGTGLAYKCVKIIGFPYKAE